MLFTLLGVIALIQRERTKNNNTHLGQDEKVDQSDVPPVRSSDGQEVDDGDSGVEFSPEEPITSQSQVSDDWSDSVFQDVLGDLSEWRADVLDALNGVVSKFKDDSLQTPVHVAPDLSVDVPQAPVHATVECGVNDVPKTTVHAASDSTVDVPKPTVCSVHDLGVDVPQASVCATTDSDNDAPLAEICAEPKGEDEAPPVVFCAQPRSEDEAPPAEFCIEPESEDEAPPAEFYAESDSKDDALLDVFSAGPKCNVAIPQAPVCETEDTSVSPQSNQLQKKNSNIIEINSDSYEITTQLGQGGFGTVYAATRLKDGLQVAVKFASSKNVIFIRSDGYSKPVPLEVALLIKATQGSRVTEIIQLLDWEELRDHYRMVLELPFPCQSLSDFIRSYRGGLGEDMARIIMRQVTTAAQTCCRRGVLHRDIKPENFLITLDTLEVKLIDFGCGDILTDEAYRYYAGTYEFIPPEYTTTGKYHGEPATVWSLGFLLFIILFKKIPNKQDLWRINGHVWTKKGFSKECCHFMSSCLQSDPKKRLELEKVHLHKWFKMSAMGETTIIDIHTCSYEMGIQLSVRFGTVYAATRLNDGLQVAVKFVSKKKKKLINIDCHPKPVPLEVALLHRVNEGPRVPEIIQILDWLEEPERYVMVLEWPKPAEELDWFILSQTEVIKEDLAWVIIRQATTAAQACCRRGVFHCDIKAESFMINPDTLELKLIKFGHGEILTDSSYTSFAGEEQYCPPEYLITGEYHGKPATVWSIGIFLFTVLFGEFPVRQDLDQFNKYIWTKDGLSKDCCHFMSSCLQTDPRQRIELEKLHLHKWFKKKKLV